MIPQMMMMKDMSKREGTGKQKGEGEEAIDFLMILMMNEKNLPTVFHTSLSLCDIVSLFWICFLLWESSIFIFLAYN